MKKCIMIVSGIVLVCCAVVSGGGCNSLHSDKTDAPRSLTGTIPPPICAAPSEYVAGDSPIISKKEIVRQTLIRKASIDFSAYEVNDMQQKCEKVIKSNSGLIDKSASFGDRQITMTARVPSSTFDKVLSELEKCGSVDSKNIEAEDVSDRVTDLNAELNSRTALRDRFRELLKKAGSVKDAICIEENLARVQEDIDRLQAALNNLNQRIEYSTIDIRIEKKTVEKKTIYGPLGYLFVGIVWGVEKLFVISH